MRNSLVFATMHRSTFGNGRVVENSPLCIYWARHSRETHGRSVVDLGSICVQHNYLYSSDSQPFETRGPLTNFVCLSQTTAETFFPSSLIRPDGSLIAGVAALLRLRRTMSFMLLCLACCRPNPSEHDRP